MPDALDLLDEQVDALGWAVRLAGGVEGQDLGFPRADRLRERRSRIQVVLGELVSIGSTPTMPIHGDLHVGQVLRWDDGYAVNDFDGNPILDPHERSRRQPAARDVAGMLQSLDHVGRVVIRRVEDADTARTVAWIAAAQDKFLSSYRTHMAHTGNRQLFDDRLLLPFRVEQELREFLYAENHLPRWRYVPDGAICSLFPRE